MKAAVCVGPEKIEMKDVTLDELGPEDVLIKIAYCGICPSDVRVYLGKSTSIGFPIILGHEFTGWIVKKGAKVRHFEIGDRVVVDPSDKCYTACGPCRRGYTNKCKNLTRGYDGFAEYYSTRSTFVYHLKDTTSLIDASFCEPLACVLHGQRRAKVGPGSNVLIVGAGPIGLLHAQASKNFGARVIVSDVIQDRLDHATSLGADMTINPQSEDLLRGVMDFTSDCGVDGAIITVGKPRAIEEAIGTLGIGGTAIIFAGVYPDMPIKLSPNFIHYEEINITGSSDYLDRDFVEALKLIENGTVNTGKLVSDMVDFDQISLGMKMVTSGEGLKVIVKINER